MTEVPWHSNLFPELLKGKFLKKFIVSTERASRIDNKWSDIIINQSKLVTLQTSEIDIRLPAYYNKQADLKKKDKRSTRQAIWWTKKLQASSMVTIDSTSLPRPNLTPGQISTPPSTIIRSPTRSSRVQSKTRRTNQWLSWVLSKSCNCPTPSCSTFSLACSSYKWSVRPKNWSSSVSTS